MPDGYRPRRAYPLLYLMHGAGESHRSWADPEKGDVANTLDGLDAIIAMPEGGLSYYTNWWNGGERADPGWERYHLDEVIPLLERRFKIRRARRWHAIAGFSMAGFGSSFLATQRPGYFGTLVPMSGLVSIRRPEVEQGLSTISGVPYQDVWGPWDGFYAEGHDPMTLVPNLEHTKVILRTGNGVPRPGVPADETRPRERGARGVSPDSERGVRRGAAGGGGGRELPLARGRARLAVLARGHAGGAGDRAVPARAARAAAVGVLDGRAARASRGSSGSGSRRRRRSSSRSSAATHGCWAGARARSCSADQGPA